MSPLSVRVLATVVAVGIATAVGHRLGQPSAPAVSTPASAPSAVEANARLADARDPWRSITTQRASSHGAAPAPPSSMLPPGPFGTTLDELKRLAGAGDARAARKLADGYRRCQFFTPAASEAELEKNTVDQVAGGLNMADDIVGQLKDHAARQGVKVDVPKADPAAVYTQQLAAQRELAADCAGVVHAEAMGWFKSYERAAELGDPDAEVDYWHSAFAQASMVDLDQIGHRKDIAVAALQRALARGDWRALAAIGELLENGYFAEPDSFGAYAYFFAAAQAPSQPIEAVPWIGNGLGRIFTGADTQTWLARVLRDIGARLDPLQRAQAERLGMDLYARCCAGGTR